MIDATEKRTLERSVEMAKVAAREEAGKTVGTAVSLWNIREGSQSPRDFAKVAIKSSPKKNLGVSPSFPSRVLL